MRFGVEHAPTHALVFIIINNDGNNYHTHVPIHSSSLMLSYAALYVLLIISGLEYFHAPRIPCTQGFCYSALKLFDRDQSGWISFVNASWPVVTPCIAAEQWPTTIDRPFINSNEIVP